MFFKRISFVFSILFFSTACSKPKHNFYVHNKGPITIDSLHIFFGDENYLIEDIQPQMSKSLRIYRLGGHKLALQPDTGKTMYLTNVLEPSFKGTLKLIITKEQIVSSSIFPN